MTDGDDAVEGGLDERDDLEPEQGTLRLLQPGDEHTREEWEAAAAGVLRKVRRLSDDDPDHLAWQELTRTTLDGVELVPLGTPADLDEGRTGERPTRQGAWDIRAHHGAGPEKQVNEAALVDLEGGCTSLWLEVAPDTDLATLLDGVLLDLAPVVLQPVPDPTRTAEAFLSHVEGRTLHPHTQLGVPAELATGALARRAAETGVRAFVADGTTVHDRGASDAQELARVLALGVASLRALEAEGLDPAEAAPLLELRVAATAEQFPTIAKLRAVRRLWTRVLKVSGVTEPAEVGVHAVTSRPMMSRYDRHTNVLRTTVAAFAAGVGGADAVTVLPFDAPLGRPDELGRRIARNVSALLIEESHVAVVTDPAGGSYAVERLTGDLAQAAWAVFQRLEAGESLDDLVEATVAERDEQVATRRRPITGLSEFPVVDEQTPGREPDGAWSGVRPWGAGFEALRDDPPSARVFVATMGAVAAHTARATFVGNLLAAGGLGVDSAGATEGPDDLVAAYDGQAVVVLAGTDAAYGEWGEDAATALRGAGATRVAVAGKPALGEGWADDSCALGVDALAFLTRTREALS